MLRCASSADSGGGAAAEAAVYVGALAAAEAEASSIDVSRLEERSGLLLRSLRFNSVFT